MDIIGKVQSVSKKKDSFVFNVLIKDEALKIVSKTDIPELKKGERVSITNLNKKKSFLSSHLETTEDSLITHYPHIRFLPYEIDYANYCKYAPFILKFTGNLKNNDGETERDFYNAIRGNEIKDLEVFKLRDKYTKDIKAKFSFREFEISRKFGVFLKNTLYFSRFPAVFPGNEIKAKFQAIENKVDKYILINKDSAKFDEFNITLEEKKSLLNLRNGMAKVYYEKFNDEILDKECIESCPLFNRCERIKHAPHDFESFAEYFSSFLKKDHDFRKRYIKIIREGENPERRTLEIHTIDRQPYSILSKISNNEPVIREEEDILIIEKPPLDRKVFGKVQKISFDEISCESEVPTANPELITPIDYSGFNYSGVFELIYSESPLKGFFIKNENMQESTVPQEKYIDTDEEENRAINLIVSDNSFVMIKGEAGSGKKFLAKKALGLLVKNEKNVLVVTDSRRKEFEKYFKEELETYNNRKNLIKVTDLNDVYKDEMIYDNLFLFLMDTLEPDNIVSLAGKCKKMAVFTSNLKEKFYNEEKIPQSLKVTLHSQHRFGKRILHFINPLLSDTMKEKDDSELKVINKDNISTEFLPIINPEKYVQFVNVSGKVMGKKNKWNREEGELTVQIVTEFIKSGIERGSIGIVVPFERQKALIEKLLEEKKITDVNVFEINEAEEKEAVIINFVENAEIKSQFKKIENLKMALTRAKSKLILVGNKSLIKRDKNLNRLIKK
jgi:hypothetical protein